MSTVVKNSVFKKYLKSLVPNKVVDYFYRYPYLSDILIGIGIGLLITGIVTCTVMTLGATLLPSIITTSTIIGGALGSSGGLSIIYGSILFACGLIATGWGFITNKFLSKTNLRDTYCERSSDRISIDKTQSQINTLQKSDDLPIKKNAHGPSPKSTKASVIKKITAEQLLEDESITVTRSSLQKILALKSIENPYQETYFIGSEHVSEYLSKIKQCEDEITNRHDKPIVKLSVSSRKYVYTSDDVENVISFLHKNIEFFSAPFIKPTQFNNWAKDNEPLKRIISKKLLSIFNRYAHMPEAAVMRQVTNTPPFLGYQEALVGTSNLKKLKDIDNPTEFSGLINNNKEPMRSFLSNEALLIEEFLIMKHSPEASEIIDQWYKDHHEIPANDRKIKAAIRELSMDNQIDTVPMPFHFGRP